MTALAINQRQYLELEKIAFGALAPLAGFMTEEEFRAVVDRMRLPEGAPFPLPVVLDVTREQAETVGRARRVALLFEGQEVGEVEPTSVYTCDKGAVAEKVYGTRDQAHPGVELFSRMGECFVGGPVRLARRAHFEFSKYELTPTETRAYFQERGWRTIVGFQTRNVPHRAHEYLQRLALEQADGLFIQPLVGTKKRGDYTPEAILAGYRALIAGFLPADRVLLGILSTAMRYAGPREAVFHAIIRRNYGCTHFIVGRDHAGVGDYYGKYDAHALALELEPELGIRVLRFHGPYHCGECGGVVTERTCPHQVTAPHAVREISGTLVRRLLSNGGASLPELMRPEVVSAVSGLRLFIEEDAE